jgi:hypothetical protein
VTNGSFSDHFVTDPLIEVRITDEMVVRAPVNVNGAG